MLRFIKITRYFFVLGITVYIIVILLNHHGNTIKSINRDINEQQSNWSENNNFDENENINNSNPEKKNTGSTFEEKEEVPRDSEIQNAKRNKESKKDPETYFLTYKEIVSLKNINFRDKLFCMIIFNKMKKSDIDKILYLARGGITSSEAAELNDILKKNLSQKDIDKIYKLLKRNYEKVYGKQLASK